MAIALTYDEVKALDPCEGSFKRVSKLLGGASGWNGNKINAAQARKAGCTFDDVVWVASELARNDSDIERRVRLWLADCAAHVLHIYERTETSEAPRKAIIAARQYARGEIDNVAWNTARDAAWNTVWAAATAPATAAAGAAARAAAWDTARDTARDVARAVARAVARDVARAAATAPATAAAGAAEEVWQFDRLVMWLSDEEPEDYPLPQKEDA